MSASSVLQPRLRRACASAPVAAMPSPGLLAAKEIAATGAEAQALHNRGWSTLLADIVDRDRGECVGGTLHARPAVPAR